MRIVRRVCIARGVTLMPATDAWQWRAGDEWTPCPEDREDLALADATRPVGVHPAHWYGHPRTFKPLARWLVTDETGIEHTVDAYSAVGAVHLLGLDMQAVSAVARMEDWY